MPVEPNTGMQLPEKGEPGFEEAKAQFGTRGSFCTHA